MPHVAKHMSAAQWVVELNDGWRRLVDTAVDGFFVLGDQLLYAKAQHAHGEWAQVLEGLEFSKRVACTFMRIARWGKQISEKSKKYLPPDYNTIDLISRLPKDLFSRLIGDGVVNPSMGRGDVAKILRLQRVEEDEERILELQPRPGKYRTIVIDPAWEYDWLSIAGRAKPGYAMQTIEELHALDLKQWADPEGCILWCWKTNNFDYEANKLVAHWGWQHRTVLTWIKPAPFGLGSYLRNSTEHCVLATLGDVTTRPAAASIPTHFFAPRGEHSEKPEEFYNIVRACSYPPYGEMNQRKLREDFTDLFMAGDLLIEAAE
jgi:N6-adenosine-specific RNA methylase IME4